MEPITTIIVTALAAGAAAGLSDTASQIVKDAYTGLKNLIKTKYAKAGASLDILEGEPGSTDLQAFTEKQLAASGAADDLEIQQQAQALLIMVERYAPEAAQSIGVTVDQVKAASLKLGDIVASGPGNVTGVSVTKSEFSGDIDISGVRVQGESPPKA